LGKNIAIVDVRSRRQGLVTATYSHVNPADVLKFPINNNWDINIPNIFSAIIKLTITGMRPSGDYLYIYFAVENFDYNFTSSNGCIARYNTLNEKWTCTGNNELYKPYTPSKRSVQSLLWLGVEFDHVPTDTIYAIVRSKYPDIIPTSSTFDATTTIVSSTSDTNDLTTTMNINTSGLTTNSTADPIIPPAGLTADQILIIAIIISAVVVIVIVAVLLAVYCKAEDKDTTGGAGKDSIKMRSMNPQTGGNNNTAPRPVRHDFRAVNSNKTNTPETKTETKPLIDNKPEPEPPKQNIEPKPTDTNNNPPKQNTDPNEPKLVLNLEDPQPTKGFILSMDLITKKEDDE